MNKTRVPPVVQRTTCARIPTAAGVFQLCHYTNNQDDKEHLALVMGEVAGGEKVLARVHSECMTGDLFGSLRCDCGEQLHAAMQQIAAEGRGVIIYLRQEGRGIGLAQKLRAYNLQDEGYDTVEANLLLGHQADEREYWAAVGIIGDLQIRSIRLLTNNPAKIEHLRSQGVPVAERVPLETGFHAENRAYMEAKVRRMRHLLRLPETPPATLAGAGLPEAISSRVALLRKRALTFAEEQGTPHVTLAYAQSLDGSIAATPGRPLTISGPVSMTLTHALRATHDAILVGIGTIIADNPQLTVRRVAGPDPQPIAVDSTLRFPVDARLFAHPRGVWIATTPASRTRQPIDLPANVRILEVAADSHGHVDLAHLLEELGRRGIRSVMVEGGAGVLAGFLARRLAHTAVVTVAPQLVGGMHALPAASRNGHTASALAHLRQVQYTPAGDDMIVWGDLEWQDA